MANNIDMTYKPLASAIAGGTGATATDIPATSATDVDANIQTGFPPPFSTPLSNVQGKALRRSDLNGMLKAATAYQAYQMNGGNTTFDPDLVAITGGYPVGAILDYYDTTAGKLYKVRNMKDTRNSDNFVTDPTKIDGTSWKIVTDYLPLTGGTMTGAIQWNGKSLNSASAGVLTWDDKNIVRSINGVNAGSDGDVEVGLISGVPSKTTIIDSNYSGFSSDKKSATYTTDNKCILVIAEGEEWSTSADTISVYIGSAESGVLVFKTSSDRDDCYTPITLPCKQGVTITFTGPRAYSASVLACIYQFNIE